MRIIQRIFASLRYHRVAAIILGVMMTLFLLFSLSTLIIRDFQQVALNLFESRLNLIDLPRKTLKQLPALQQLSQIRSGLVKTTGQIFVHSLLVFGIVVFIINTVSLLKRRSELIAYKIAGKGSALVSWQIALENVFLYLLFYLGVVLVLICFQGTYLKVLEKINQTVFQQQLPATLKTLQQHITNQQLDQIFKNQITAFNGHNLLFGDTIASQRTLADYDRYLLALLWRGCLIVFSASYLPALCYNWYLNRKVFR
ncbi:hypothetical protein [Loigolactobacillus bifermentans]|uniref:hypothetical protein n=1 Tax=Loigolactobacillus bifermentans TaxID=1607 RepID=UPI00070EBEB0|nr:hypothetical protein [Loigolactobacillus bifermentans]QGG59061.1 hypothetical protein LB003_00520 [Loigolactobacillus bifermentans]